MLVGRVRGAALGAEAVEHGAPTMFPSEPPLPLVRADELGRRQDVPLDRLLKRGLGRAGGELEFGVEGVLPEDVVVAAVAGGRTRPAVSDRAEVVSPPALRARALPEPCWCRKLGFSAFCVVVG
jgi:hypothetical protein